MAYLLGMIYGNGEINNAWQCQADCVSRES